jgi:hypothetical protein
MPGLRTRSAGTKVTEEEYAQIEKQAEARGQNVSEWCRDAILREMRGGPVGEPIHGPALAEILGVRLLLVNVLRPLAAGEKMAPERFDKLLDEIGEVKHELAAKLQQHSAKKRPQREETKGNGNSSR